MKLLSQQQPRPRSSSAAPSYPRALGAGLGVALLVAACNPFLHETDTGGIAPGGYTSVGGGGAGGGTGGEAGGSAGADVGGGGAGGSGGVGGEAGGSGGVGGEAGGSGGFDSGSGGNG